MKISNYTLLFDIENKEFFTYNTLSNALIEIDEETYSQLRRLQSDKTEFDCSLFDAELYKVLSDNNILTENEKDDFLLYKSIIWRQRQQNNSMHLTIAPTMDCCFKCHYCFERYKAKEHMSETVMNSIVKYVTSFKDLASLKLTWFGGEPLMAPYEIEAFDKKLKKEFSKTITSNIITTGFHINTEIIKILKNAGITSAQITLDGKKETHNKIKFVNDCDDVFEKFMRNVELLNDTAPDIEVVFRVNLTKENAGEYVDLYNYLMSRFKGRKNIAASPAFVMDRGASNLQSVDKSIFFNHKERSEYILNLTNKYHLDSPFIRYPKPFFYECAIRNNLAISFDAERNAYKCWELIGNKEYMIGQINDNVQLTNINPKNLNRQNFGADPLDSPQCIRCKFLPICNGGCPIQRIENEFEGKNNCTCTPYKDYMEDFLKLHIALKKQGYQNY